MELVKSNKDITDTAACLGKDQTMVQEILPNEIPLWSSLFVIFAQMLMYLMGAPASGGKKFDSFLYKAVELFQNLADLSGGDEPLAGSPSLGSS